MAVASADKILADVRAGRRKAQREEGGLPSDLRRIKKGIEERDRRDLDREVSPLRRAEDGIYLDTTRLGLDQVIGWMADRVEERRAQGKGSLPA